MKQRTWFLIFAAATALSLSCACLLVLALVISKCITRDTGISVFNLLVDIAIGIFTIWGLYWAATEFARASIKPDLQLLPGEGKQPIVNNHWGLAEYPIMRQSPFRISGWKETPGSNGKATHLPHIPCGLYLQNKKSKAGRYIRVVIRIVSTPAPFQAPLVRKRLEKFPSRAVQDPDTNHLTQTIQLQDTLVVYQSPVYIGELIIRWPPETSDSSLPRRVILKYAIYTLDGHSNGETCLYVQWK